MLLDDFFDGDYNKSLQSNKSSFSPIHQSGQNWVQGWRTLLPDVPITACFLQPRWKWWWYPEGVLTSLGLLSNIELLTQVADAQPLSPADSPVPNVEFNVPRDGELLSRSSSRQAGPSGRQSKLSTGRRKLSERRSRSVVSGREQQESLCQLKKISKEAKICNNLPAAPTGFLQFYRHSQGSRLKHRFIWFCLIFCL